MILACNGIVSLPNSTPRTRGDDPRYNGDDYSGVRYSPHTRG